MVIPTDAKASDIIEVRPDERFDEHKLSEFVKGKFPGSDLSLAIKQFGGGAANLTYNLRFGDPIEYEYVLRRPPLGPVAKSAHDMGREYKVLSVLHKSYPYAPRAFLYSEDTSIIGSSVFILDRKQGFVITKSIPEKFKNNPAVGKKNKG